MSAVCIYIYLSAMLFMLSGFTLLQHPLYCLQIHDTFFLVAIIDNEYVESTLLFDVFDEILACDRDRRRLAAGIAGADSDSAPEPLSGAKNSANSLSDGNNEWF